MLPTTLVGALELAADGSSDISQWLVGDDPERTRVHMNLQTWFTYDELVSSAETNSDWLV